MNNSPTPNALSPSLAEITDEIVEHLQRGEAVDPEAYVQRHPQYEQRIRELLPAMTMLAEFSHDDGDAPLRELGDYRILREIGRGGMGIVYEAEQISLRRRVALKVLPLAGLLKEEQLARFKNEAFAAASLDHEHIVHAYAVGCERGVHFFAMQYVEGRNLAEVIEQLRSSHGGKSSQDNAPHETTVPAAGTAPDVEVGQDAEAVEIKGAVRHPPEGETAELGLGSTAGEPLGKEYFRTIARLIAQGAEALDYAHQRGVVHRDVKPSNLMLDGQQRLYVTDFGLAFVDGDRNLTATGDILGTIRYMSPEQAAGDTRRVDHRSDIYSLGATLYELAALRPAFSGADQLQLLKRIAADDPPPVRRHNRRIPLDLETIVSKAMAKDPTERYATAQDLADDLLRFAADEPIAARPPSVPQRMSRWTRRHSTAVLATLILLLISTLASSGAAALIWREKDRADQNAIQARASEQRERTERVRAQDAEKRERTERLRAQAAEAREREQRQEAENAQREAEVMSNYLIGILSSPDPERFGRNITVAEILDKAAAELEGSFAEEPLLRARISLWMGACYMSLGRYDQAAPLFEDALTIYESHLGLSHELTLHSQGRLAHAFEETGQRKKACELRERTLALAREKLGADDPVTLKAMTGLARAYSQVGEIKKGVELQEQALTLQKEILGPNDTDTLQAMANLANLYAEAGQLTKAIEQAEEGLRLSREIRGRDHVETLANESNLAEFYRRVGRYRDAIMHHKSLLERRREKLGRDHPNTLDSMNLLANAYRSAGRFDEALDLHRKTLQLRTAKLGVDHPATLASMHNFALVCNIVGRSQEAIDLLEKTWQQKQEKLGQDHPGTLTTMRSLAIAYISAQQFQEAIDLLERNVELRREKLGPTHPDTMLSMSALGAAYLKAGRVQEALTALEELLALQRKVLGDKHPATLNSLSNLGSAYLGVGRISDAIKCHDESHRLHCEGLGRSHPDTLAAAAECARAYSVAGRTQDAIALYKETLELLRQRFGIDDWRTITTLNNLATTYWRAKDFEESVLRFEQAVKLHTRKYGERHPKTLRCKWNLGINYCDAGRLDEGIRLLKKTLEMQREVNGSDHPHTIECMHNLANAYFRVQKFDRSLPLWSEAVDLTSRSLGDADPKTLAYKAYLGFNYHALRQFEKAIPCLEEVHAKAGGRLSMRDVRRALIDTYIRTGRPEKAVELLKELMAATREAAPPDSMQLARVLAVHSLNLLRVEGWEEAEAALRECLVIREKGIPDNWLTFNTKSMLGEALLGQGKLEEAEPLLLEGYQGMKEREQEIPSGGETRIPEAVERLVALYKALEKPEAVAQWQELLNEDEARQAAPVAVQNDGDPPANSNRPMNESAAP